MSTVHHYLIVLFMIALTSIIGCSQPDTKPMQAFLDKLSHGPETDFPSILFGYSQSSPGAQKVLLGMLQTLRPPSPEQHMTVDAMRRSGRFIMVVAHVPWHRGPHAYEYQPIIICREGQQDKVVGYILPFNDIFSLIGDADGQSTHELTQWYLERYGSRNGPGT